ncbi:probable LRR receptor-like serine/threonine-protein kinase At3g47570 isoform X1 [Ricinus communis]|uniref:probable LRR receptor-like serine/threonine-protein kinase At3g47570 isoform X1 n=2 Tax=Ricinus communis TaxID=3988 RepID=UPI00201AB777|nr:probable LRR receptor-like serine/threonine-protein kinase At3g47570 isoform X1 [Ricinus communis]
MAIKWRSLHVSLYWCLLCSFNFTTCLRNETDRLALISFKDAIQQDPFQVLSSWNDSMHFCHWRGVICSRRHPDRVVALNLKSQGLVGTMSPHIGNLSFLKNIDFRNNSFHGQIPQEIGRLRRLKYIILSNNSFQGNIPTNLSYCLDLMELNLIDNKLVGNIPVELGSLPKLGALGLGKNNLTGTITPSIMNLSSLWQISLMSNSLQGQIPEEISQLKNLEYLMFQENNLSGEIPRGLFNISSIQYFSMGFNQLHGSIPSNIGLTLPKLWYLSVNFNKLTGPIPISLSNASGLTEMGFSMNAFSGLFPKDLGMLKRLLYLDCSSNQLQDDLSFIESLTNCSSLTALDLQSNLFQGNVPNSIANLSKDLMAIALSDNQLKNTIPQGIENLLNLRFFQFASNNLTGPILIDFKKFPKLQLLDLHSNKFTGSVPSSIGGLSMLTALYMGGNNLQGSIPPSLGDCQNLIELDLSLNNLSGSIPKQVIGLSSLSISLLLASNALTGPIPSEVGLLQNLIRLDLSDNGLSGVIPNSISRCMSLEKLHLEGNSFEGEIPQILGALQGLQELDISRNNFSGPIPDSLTELHWLNYLNLSFNQLQGKVPENGIFLNASAVSLVGNSGLCGGITEMKHPSCLFPNSKKKKVSLKVKVVIAVVIATTFSALLVCFSVYLLRKRKSRKNISVPFPEHQFMRISYAELFKATNAFSMANIIGLGSYGSVYKAFLEQVEMTVAVKVLNLQQRGASKSFLSECRALGSIRHRNLLKLLSVCSSIDFEGNDFRALIYEFMPNGSLERWLHAHSAGDDGRETESRNLTPLERLNIAIDIATAIEYLHSGSLSTIIHGDLKPSNVLLDEEMTANIGDFGLARIVSSVSGEIQQCRSTSGVMKGSIGYVAPEYGIGDIASIEGDVYSYGILLLEMFTGKKPTDESFKDDLNLHTFVETSFPHRVMEIVDPRILSGDEGVSFKGYIISVLRIGVACSMEQQRQRMEMRGAISELQKIKDSYQKERLKKRTRNAYQIGVQAAPTIQTNSKYQIAMLSN